MTTTHFRMMSKVDDHCLDAEARYGDDTLVLSLPDGPREFVLSHVRHCLDKPFHVIEPKGGWRRSFTTEEKRKLRPIAETLALLDGNAFFGQVTTDGEEWYEGYLSTAHAIYESNGGDSGWAGQASFVRESENSPAAATGSLREDGGAGRALKPRGGSQSAICIKLRCCQLREGQACPPASCRS